MSILSAVVLTATVYLPLVAYMPDGGTAAMTADNCDDLRRIGAAWSYQWHPWPVQCDGMQMIPMIWSMSHWSDTAAPSPYLLGFNEPDRLSQANMTPDEGAVAWRKLEAAYPLRMLVSPAPANSPQWLREWRIAYLMRYGREPRIFAIAGHIYRPELAEAERVLAEFVSLAQEWRKTLWITEYSFPPCWYTFGGDASKAVSVAQQFTRTLRQTPEVERYAWFSSRDYADASWPAQCRSGLYDEHGRATEYGDWFALRGML